MLRKRLPLLPINAFIGIFIFTAFAGYAQKIDRKALVERHTIHVSSFDSLSALSVGNGKFAFTVDVTGLQSFPAQYQGGVPLGTESEWGWHSFMNTSGFKREEALRTYELNGRPVTYAVESGAGERQKAAATWFRQNPHRLQLGNLGFRFLHADGTAVLVEDISHIDQTLNMWTGEIKSSFTIDGIPVTVSTLCDQQQDALAVQVSSALIQKGRLQVFLLLPYPTGQWADVGTSYNAAKDSTELIHTNNGASITRLLDTTAYTIDFDYTAAAIKKDAANRYTITPAASNNTFTLSCRFAPVKLSAPVPLYSNVKAGNAKSWPRFWTTGAAIDFTGSTNKRAAELERRIILSQYLIRIQETGNNPPQETGLTYNSWFGKPHMEMPYWHLAHYPYWGKAELLQNSLSWYTRAAPKARALAQRQGYQGLRWPKVTDNNGDESPSSVGAFLLWDQPHLIYFAESIYRNTKDKKLLQQYKDLIFGTADFMADYPFYEKDKDRYILGKGVIPAQERFKAEETFNPTYELVYWHWALDIAQQWRQRLGLPRNKKWDTVINKLSALPVQNNMYLATESATDSYTNPRYRTDHPSVLMAYGVMPQTGQVDTAIMKHTFNWIWDNWSWKDTWGWDFPMVAMTATRLGMPEKAMDALFMDITTNTYLINGHNYQNDRLRLYLPGNGGLLSAIALMCAGYDGCSTANPGIPKDGTWQVKWEGLKKQP